MGKLNKFACFDGGNVNRLLILFFVDKVRMNGVMGMKIAKLIVLEKYLDELSVLAIPDCVSPVGFVRSRAARTLWEFPILPYPKRMRSRFCSPRRTCVIPD
jgi:hypothetical protein